ncbi:hypothetical protein HK405_007146 [Cladochytrium tenue]|nr:hypothetical protein HK405_007146 [Cladochytrium tenue]
MDTDVSGAGQAALAVAAAVEEAVEERVEEAELETPATGSAPPASADVTTGAVSVPAAGHSLAAVAATLRVILATP